MLAPWNGIGDLRFQAGGALLAIRDKYISTVSGYSTGDLYFPNSFGQKLHQLERRVELFCF